MKSNEEVFQSVVSHARQTKVMASITALLDWDQQTGMPAAASEYRAEQSTWLAGAIHLRETDSQFGEDLQQLSETDLCADPHSESGATIRELHHRFNKKSRLPIDLVQKQASLHSRGQQIWVKSRQADDYSIFSDTLDEIFQLKREEAQATGETDCLYDALLDDYEPGASTSEVASALSKLKDDLVPLIARVGHSSKEVGHSSKEVGHSSKEINSLLRRNYPVAAQKALVHKVTSAIGFDYESGRLDVAHHPFCTELGPRDCRITTRYDESFFSSAFFGSLHEVGHGMYEQGLPKEQYGLPPGTYCSLGVHESQSRLWENLVGRSAGFWHHFMPIAKAHFSKSLDGVSEELFWLAINQIQPSLIRVEADEATYNLHIIIRFELEQALLNNDLQAIDLPQAWNEKYQEYLGIRPPSDKDGVLQDIHWSAGLVGYFPTYSIGNIYASQLMASAETELGDLQSQFAKGQFGELLDWLRRNVHQAGNRWRASHLIENITGNSIDHQPLIQHLTQKCDRLGG